MEEFQTASCFPHNVEIDISTRYVYVPLSYFTQSLAV